MNMLETLDENIIKSKIYTLRNVQVMLDRDLAELYQVKAIRLREQVKRNPSRFPDDFMFQLTPEEVESMVSQNAIPSKKHLGGSLPYAFTEQGVASLSSVLTSQTAIDINITIMRAFVSMRKFMLENAAVFQRLSNLEQWQSLTDKKLDQIFNAIENKTVTPKQGIFFEGQIFDAYVLVSDLIKQAKEQIILIDNYIDESVLLILAKRNKNVKAEMFTKTLSPSFLLDIKKHNQQYPVIQAYEFTQAHDRFLIIDQQVYHLGASLKDLGKKWFAFSKMHIQTIAML
ncbi:MAG: ORF6N domain-containing protein, partial [Thiomicrospira sp.]|uniref:ORF6N domain-containing protein n=1 Tax=Thiomicrospira sp. TaxID=935 RepID=UPI0019F285ED